jgi:tetratricopeptide (TPR) repeat protein
MRVAARWAIELDPLLPEAHDALAMMHARDAQWEQSEKSFRRAIELDPNRSPTRVHMLVFLLMPLGRIEEAIAQIQLAAETDPLSPQVQGNAAYILISAGRFEEAAAHCLKLPDDYPYKIAWMARARLGQGRIDEAIRMLEASRVNGSVRAWRADGFIGYAYARAGRREEAEKIAAAVPFPLEQAIMFAGLGDKDRAFAALDRAIPMGPCRVGRALTFPELALLRGDPRLKIVRKKVGLPQ